MSYFILFRYVKISWSTSIKGEFTTNFSVLPFLPVPILKSVHVWPQLDNEISIWFSYLHSTEWACEFLLLIYHCSIKQIRFRLQTSLIYKKKKNVKNGCKEKIHREITVLESLSTVKCVQVVRLATLLKWNPRSGVSETAVCRFSAK